MKPRLLITPLPYHQNPLTLFTCLAQRPGAVLLDSGRPDAPGGRYDILSSDPCAVLTLDQQGQVHCDADIPLPTAPFAAQQALLDTLDLAPPDSELPFLGGLIGYWGYDLGSETGGSLNQFRDVVTLPRSRLGLYDWAVIQDHEQRQTWLVATAERREQVQAWLNRAPASTSPFALTSVFCAEMDRAGYGQRFRDVQKYLQAGDCYQINLAQRFSAGYKGDPWQAYCLLRQATPTPFGGYLAWQDKAVMSLSPERFIEVRGDRVETRPIKGTRPRGTTLEMDKVYAEELVQSPKDRAENVMIVDLLRNDLGRVCRPGSVQVPQLCQLESYANVHHLVSVVTGELGQGKTPLDLLAAAFPGGSITGAPKVRAMQIIDELEPSRRSVYCGSLGYVDIRGHMDTSIAIRTVLADADRLHLWGGGGLVADSDEEAEYRETLHKIGRLMDALTHAESIAEGSQQSYDAQER
ncbi:aminodeoxychorismate synthase component I [Halomonas sp. M20]|uniref:aminodeoxychorismate synthase component I n=1 Tax=Halomonas sp. M20 TaxID=2763264 RepID=UPI001D0A52C4|nr:aminodeoxychorismate synthase component I [Halomonas sp. M20]